MITTNKSFFTNEELFPGLTEIANSTNLVFAEELSVHSIMQTIRPDEDKTRESELWNVVTIRLRKAQLVNCIQEPTKNDEVAQYEQDLCNSISISCICI